MKYLLTGAAGFIGFHTACKLINEGHEVVCVDNFSSYYSKDLKILRAKNLEKMFKQKILKFDLCDSAKIEKVITSYKPDSVIHLAAQAGVRMPLKDFGKYVESNLLGFSNLIISSARFGIENFIYASSSSVYGNESAKKLDENLGNLKPISFYGATKLSNEILASSISYTTGMKTRGLRFFTVYGPFGRPDMAYFRLMSAALNNKSFNLFGNGTISRDFTFISDNVNSIHLLSRDLYTRDQGHSDVVNVGGGSPYSMNDLVCEVQKATGQKININLLEKDLSDVLSTNASTQVLCSLIDFTPATSLTDGIQQFHEWASEIDPRKLDQWCRSTI